MIPTKKQLQQQAPGLYYGLESKAQAFELARQVCDVLGHGENNRAVEMLLETAAAETGLGTFPDRTENNGFGLCQNDRIGVEDIKKRAKERDRQRIIEHFGYDIRTVRPEELKEDPLLAFIFCRLHYKLIPNPIPSDLHNRATYWKWFYNTKAGKGTPEHYIKAAQRHL